MRVITSDSVGAILLIGRSFLNDLVRAAPKIRTMPTAASSTLTSPLMSTVLAAGLAVFSLGACGSSDSAGTAPNADAAAADTAEITDDSGRDGAGGSDAGMADVGLDVADAGAGPKPPAGYTQCGSATFTQADSLAACTNIGASPKACDAITIHDGLWIAWCAPGKKELYVWAEINGARQSADGGGCIPKFSSGAYDLNPGGGGGAGTPNQVTFPSTSPNATYEMHASFGSPAPSGSGFFAFTANLGSGPGTCYYLDPNAPVVAGFAVNWK
jgi:hypothetical protein